MMSEAFIYLWYVAATKMYYLGVHNGKDLSYTHSAQSSEEFRSIVPHSQRLIEEKREFWRKYLKGEIKGIRYRILPKRIILEDGTDYEKMCKREHELLVNRKNRCWNRYYNNSLGDPRYVDTSGENAWNWKGGITYDMKSYMKEYMKEYHKTPKYKEYQLTPKYRALKNESDRRYRKKIQHTPEYKEYYRKRRETLEYKEYQEKYQKERNQTLERKLYMKEYAQKPEVKEYQSKYRSTPEYKERKKKYDAVLYARKKLERQGEGTLEAFL